MAKQTSFGFTNNTQSTKKLTMYKLGMKSNYSVVEDEAGSCILENKTCPLDQPERIVIKGRDISKVYPAVTNLFPGKSKEGVQVVVQLETLLSTTDSDHPEYRVDEPLTVCLTIATTKSANITDSHISQAIDRLNSVIYTDDGLSRISDLIRKAVTPTAD